MKRVLVTPLDWGLGHATRCIPIIRLLLLRKCFVYIASSGDALTLLKNEFPNLPSFALPAYNPVYSSKKNMIWKMATQLGKFIKTINEEHHQVANIISEHQIDLIIADNRYGCWSGKIPSVFITHQLTVLMPKGFRWLEKSVNKVNAKLINKFSRCWVPDDADQENNLSGKLSSYLKTKIRKIDYIGPLSRLRHSDNNDIQYDILFILSGPEPQRTIFEKIAAEQLKNSGLRYYIVNGVSVDDPLVLSKSGFHGSDHLQMLISKSSVVLARSGYSTIMDLAATGKQAILIPTPGQTEQEYLAERWFARKVFYSVSQDDFDLAKAWAEVKAFPGFKIVPERSTPLETLLDKVLNRAI